MKVGLGRAGLAMLSRVCFTPTAALDSGTSCHFAFGGGHSNELEVSALGGMRLAPNVRLGFRPKTPRKRTLSSRLSPVSPKGKLGPQQLGRQSDAPAVARRWASRRSPPTGRVRRPAPSLTSARFAKLKLSGRTKAPADRRPVLDHAIRLGSMSNDWPTMAVKWRALSLKRLEHFDELKRTGRWRRHFATAYAFEEAFRNASSRCRKMEAACRSEGRDPGLARSRPRP